MMKLNPRLLKRSKRRGYFFVPALLVTPAVPGAHLKHNPEMPERAPTKRHCACEPAGILPSVTARQSGGTQFPASVPVQSAEKCRHQHWRVPLPVHPHNLSALRLSPVPPRPAGTNSGSHQFGNGDAEQSADNPPGFRAAGLHPMPTDAFQKRRRTRAPPLPPILPVVHCHTAPQ